MEKQDGTKLYTLEGNETTRPTLDRVKETVFNIIQNEIKDSVVLDLFAGSGAIGLEAISRGAKKAVLCDKSKQAINIIEKNVDKTHAKPNANVYNLDFKTCLNKIAKEKFDIVYLDPPYKTNLVIEAIKLILELDLIDEKSKIIIETDEESIIEKLEKLEIEIESKRKCGRAYIIFVKKK